MQCIKVHYIVNLLLLLTSFFLLYWGMIEIKYSNVIVPRFDCLFYDILWSPGILLIKLNVL